MRVLEWGMALLLRAVNWSSCVRFAVLVTTMAAQQRYRLCLSAAIVAA
jgi:hypothetical protein